MTTYLNSDVISCEHSQCASCGHPIWVEFAYVNGKRVPTAYDDASDSTDELEACPNCGKVF